MRRKFFSVAYMFLLTFAFTSVVSAVKGLSDERIARNRQIKLQRIVLQVLGWREAAGMSGQELLRFFATRVTPLEVEGKSLYVGYEADGRTLRGYAFPVGGPGFWGPVYGMVGVDAHASRILGIAFYRHSETPGLGGRITEEWFSKQFEGLPLYPVRGERRIFYLKPAGTAGAANELDAITGATGTSRAVEAFLNRELDRFLKGTWRSLSKG